MPEKQLSRHGQIDQDNAPAHSSQLVATLLSQPRTPTSAAPPHTPNLALCDLFYFPQIKLNLKGRRFDKVEIIKQNMMQQTVQFLGFILMFLFL